MRITRYAILFVLVPFALSAQTSTSTPFPSQVVAKYDQLAALHSLKLTGTATWSAGSVHESGTITLQASTDGSTVMELSLSSASRKESSTALGASRICEWVDAQSQTHQIGGLDCEVSVPWFAPFMLAQPIDTVRNLLTVTDDGIVTRAGSSFHELSYRTLEHARDTATSNTLTEDTRVRVLYDPQTLLPASTEFSIHPDNDLRRQIPVRVVYSGYETVSGLPIPFQIDRYVNGVLQLSITLTNASLN